MRDAKTTVDTPTSRAAYGIPCPKFPAEATTIGRLGPIFPSPASRWTATHVPRPLNERMGLSVSTFTMTGEPSRADRPGWRYWGEPVNAGSIVAWTARMASASSSGTRIIVPP